MKYIPNSQANREKMLQEIGVESIESLFSAIPDNLRLNRDLNISPPVSEFSLLKNLKRLAGQQATNSISFLGAGAYRRFIPAAILPIVSRAEFLTSYTPYQPEVSQGNLQVMFEFQSLLAQLTGMEIANASLYEGASAAGEAVLMSKRIRKNQNKVLISAGLHPEYVETIKTYVRFKNLKIVEIPLGETGQTDLEFLQQQLDETTLCSVWQSVNFYGVIEDQKGFSDILNDHPALSIVVIPDMSCLGLLAPPGKFGADIVVGEGQSLGLPLSYGGPNLGIFASKKRYMRQMPGRLSGQTVDENGNRAFCLTLATREQHIRREKATSNICSNQALCALWVTVYLSLLGRQGIKQLSRLNFSKTHYAMERIRELEGYKIRYSGQVYNEFVLELPVESAELTNQLKEKKIIAGTPLSRFQIEDKRAILVNITEVNTKEDIDYFIECLQEIKI